MIDHIIDILEKHEFLTALSLITAFYLAPIFAKAVFTIIGGTIAFIVKLIFNDALERKIRSWVANILRGLLNNENIQVNDIPLLDSEYLCIFRLYIPITDHLNVYIPTVRIRVRCWRLLRRSIWLYLRHLDNRIAFYGYLKLLCSEELKEINLQNASITWECHEHEDAAECYRGTNFDFAQLNIIEEKLKRYEFHLLWERANLRVTLPGENIAVENIGGYISNNNGNYEMYLHGLLEGQIMSIGNIGKGIRNYRLIIPAINLTPLIWTMICDNIPALTVLHSSNGHSMGRMVNVICQLRIRDKIEVAEIEWTFRDGNGEYVSAASNHSYSLTAIEGSFHIKEMTEFCATGLNLKVNNHNIGLAGTITFANPINQKVNQITEDGIFSIAFDANNFNFINGLEVSVLDRFILDGEIQITPNAIHFCCHSDKEHAVNAFKFSYKDLSIIVDRFFGHLTVEGSTCFSQDIGCYLVSATKHGSSSIYDRSLIHLQNFYYDLIDQAFAIQVRANGIDVPNFITSKTPRSQITSLLDIHGDFSSAGNINVLVKTI
ncbi:MAG: hypothetical protein MJ050_05095 [Phascolarctobacterium sp.]|nr:hypothetical protein [Phascolarctobacterium sp.]